MTDSEDTIPEVPVTALEELLDNFTGDGTGGEMYLIDRLREIIDKARGNSVESNPVGVLGEKLPNLFEIYKPTPESIEWYNSTQRGRVFPQECLDKASNPLPEGDYKIHVLDRDTDSDLIGLKLPTGLILFIWPKDLKGIPEVGGTLQVKHNPLSYTCIPGERYTLEERVELYREKAKLTLTWELDVTSDPEEQHVFLDKSGIPRVKM